MRRTTNHDLDRLKQLAAEGYNQTDTARLLDRTSFWVNYWGVMRLRIKFSTAPCRVPWVVTAKESRVKRPHNGLSATWLR